MKGHYDPILPWPFRQQVTFTVIDQQYDPSKTKNEVGILNTEQTSVRFSGRPTREENPEHMGVPRLISHKVLFTRRYVEYDTLFLRVEVGPHNSQSRYSDSDSDYLYWTHYLLRTILHMEGPCWVTAAPTRVLVSHKGFQHPVLCWTWDTVSFGFDHCWVTKLSFSKAVVLHDDTTLNLVHMTRIELLVTNNFELGGTKPRYCAHGRL